MSPRVLVSFPDACELSAAFAGQLNVILRERALDSRIIPLGLVRGLSRYDCVVFGCSIDHGEPLDALGRFAEDRAGELERVPSALFVLGPAGASTAGLELVRARLAPVSIGRFDPEDSGDREARRWAAQLAWTLVCCTEPIEEAPWPGAATVARAPSHLR